MKAATRDWIDKAEHDYLASVDLARRRKLPLHDMVCFHCQQAAEKYLNLERKMANHGKHRIHGKRMGYGICGTHLPGVGDPPPNSLTFRVFRVFRGSHFRI
jgi:hypothetical protein